MQQITWSKDFSQINHKKVHFGYQRGPSCWNSLTVQYCGYHAIILWWVNRIKILMNSTFDILIKCNKSLEAKTSLRSTIGKLEIFWKAQTSWQLTSCLWTNRLRNRMWAIGNQQNRIEVVNQWGSCLQNFPPLFLLWDNYRHLSVFFSGYLIGLSLECLHSDLNKEYHICTWIYLRMLQG